MTSPFENQLFTQLSDIERTLGGLEASTNQIRIDTSTFGISVNQRFNEINQRFNDLDKKIGDTKSSIDARILPLELQSTWYRAIAATLGTIGGFVAGILGPHAFDWLRPSH